MITNEHFVPTLGLDLDACIASGDVTAVHHLIRYLWAIEVLASRPNVTKLLDLGCGDGYGCFGIAERYPQLRVVGVDCDEDAVTRARQTYALPNLEFLVGDAMQWDATIGSQSYDCIISFDSIEHVEHRELYLEGVVEHLTEEGCMMLSTPCGWPTEIITPEWEGHKIEYSARGLYDFLSRYFHTIQRPDDHSLAHVEIFRRLKGTGISYLLRMNPVLCEGRIRIANPYRTDVKQNAAALDVVVFSGDWTGSGIDRPGLYDRRSGTAFLLQPSENEARWEEVEFGIAGKDWHILSGDWLGRGRDTLAFYNLFTGRLLMFEENKANAIWKEIEFGQRSSVWLPVAGDWSGAGVDTVGLYDPGNRSWHLPKNDQEHRAPFTFGPSRLNMVPLAGRWTGENRDFPVLYSRASARFHFKRCEVGDDTELVVNYGVPGNLGLLGDWDGDGIDTVGILSLADGRFHLRNDNSPGEGELMVEPPQEVRTWIMQIQL